MNCTAVRPHHVSMPKTMNCRTSHRTTPHKTTSHRKIPHCTSSNKAQTHFPFIRKLTGISYDKMLFFDDCNWGDHVGMVGRGCTENTGKGVVGHRTPRGLTVKDWYKGLELYRKAR
mmetsp:Transcript_20454/g.43257  ORF Transcript_20454/g.43257 Transcript_20454/m.43257 type:complete len:116 (+) Transcript_20454:1053-1400(+)